MMRHLATLLAAIVVAVAVIAPAPITAAVEPTFRLEAVPGRMPRVVRLTPAAAVRAAGTAIRDVRVRAAAIPTDADWGWIRVGTEAAWTTATTKGEGVVVAVIDSGVDTEHPAIAGAMWTNPGETAGNSIDDDGNGYVDDVHGWNVADGNGDVFDEYGHGTHVAGIIAAKDDGADSLGIAPNAEIMAIRVIGADGGGSIADVMEGISWAVDHGADVINLSLGAESDEDELALLQPAFDAARAAGTLIVAAAGNDGPDDQIIGFPSGLNGVIGVASTDADDAGDGPVSYYSSRHRSVDLAAPGYGILSTLPGGAHGLESGTSMAAPHVAAVAALLYGQRPTATPAAIEALLGGTTDRYPLVAMSGSDAIAEQIGDGLLNAAAAVAANAANAGGVSMPEHYIDDTHAITVTPLRPSGAAPTSCSIVIRRRVHPGVATSPNAATTTRSTNCAAVTITAAWIRSRFPTLSGVNGEHADLELVATVNGTVTIRRLLVAAPDTAAPLISAAYPRLGAGGIITAPIANIATIRSESPDAYARWEMRIRTIGASSWSATYPIVADGSISYAPRTVATRTINLTATAGRRLEIAGRTTDATGNVSAWSSSTTAVVPQWLNPTAAPGSPGFVATTRSGAIGGSVMVGTKSGATLPKLMTGSFSGNLFAFTGTYSTSTPVCYTVKLYWSEGGTNRTASKVACTNADWAGDATMNDETLVPYANGDQRVLLFRWALTSRTYTKAEIRATSMADGSSFEIDAIATKLP
jgi:subtilisin family serine protease